MNKLLYIILLSIIVTNCSFRPVVKHHGVPFLEKKQANLIINFTNKNDIIKLIGPPSTKSSFDNDVFIYIERKTSTSKLTKLGKKKLLTNNVLVLEIDNKGLLLSKSFYNKEDMNNINFNEEETGLNYSKRSFVNSFLSSLRQIFEYG